MWHYSHSNVCNKDDSLMVAIHRREYRIMIQGTANTTTTLLARHFLYVCYAKNPLAINVWLHSAIHHTNTNFVTMNTILSEQIATKPMNKFFLKKLEKKPPATINMREKNYVCKHNRLYQQIWIMQKQWSSFNVRYN